MNPANDWMDTAGRLLDALRGGAGGPATSGDDAPAEHSSDCRWCPICQVAAVVRGERPEVTAALADVLTATATALRTFAAATAPAAPADAAAAQDAEREPAPAAQRIDIA